MRSVQCSVCGCIADFPELRICVDCADWFHHTKLQFAPLSLTSLPTGGHFPAKRVGHMTDALLEGC